MGRYEGYKEEQDGRSSLTGGDFLVVRLAAHVSNGLKSRIHPVVGRI